MTRGPTLIFVYNADGGLFDRLSDAAHKILSPATYQCDLCRITHGWFKERSAWSAFIRALDADCQFLHRDGYRRRFSDLAVRPPVVLRLVDGRPEVCVAADDLARCNDLDALMRLIEGRCLPADPQ
jgi:hypothetical protein